MRSTLEERVDCEEDRLAVDEMDLGTVILQGHVGRPVWVGVGKFAKSDSDNAENSVLKPNIESF